MHLLRKADWFKFQIDEIDTFRVSIAHTFSNEVDFGVGAVIWMNLTDTLSEWSNALNDALHRGKSDKQQVIQAIETMGFDLRHFTERMCELYDGSSEN